jgi:pectate lyase
MSKKIIWAVVGVIVLVGVFFGGVSYGKGQTASSTSTSGAAAYAARTRGAGGGFGGATIGQIISEDSTSITVALPGGGSKIVFLDNTIPITKQVSGTMSDLTIGTNVSVVGTANTDGSVTAQSIQIRPNMPANSAVPAKQ